MIRRLSPLLLLLATSCALVADMRPQPFSQNRAHIETEKLCVLAGMGDERAPGQDSLVVSGTDMGVTYSRGDWIEIIFGDTGTKERVEHDDAFGAIDLKQFPDGDAVEAYCRDHGHAPPITFAEKSETTFAGVNPGVAMDGLKTPIIAFANGRHAASREFAVGPLVGTQYAPGGIMHHPDCRGDDCAPSTVPEPATGALHAPDIIEEWTEVRSDRSVDLYWNVSSWNPYRVTLMKTRIAY